MASSSWILCLFLPYIAVCSLLRYHRRDKMAMRFNFPNRASLAKMTNNDAHAILKELAEFEFPSVIKASLFFALFKTYGIPSIADLLVETGQLANMSTSSKRAADTSVILNEVSINHPTSERAIEGISRMNYLHNGYRKAGKISDADMLYTLSLFTLEPMRWIRRFEWRLLTDLEKCAFATFWKGLGDAMDIPYTALKSGETGWPDGLQWLEELEAWSLDYEDKAMVPAESNKRLALNTVDLLFWQLPHSWRGIADKFVVALLEPRLRIAMMFPNSPQKYHSLLAAFIHLRRLLLRYLFLPRPWFMRTPYIPTHPDPITGRFHMRKYRSHPWYMKPTLWRRWGPKAWLTWGVGGVLPGDDGDKYHPEGYLVAEAGPEHKRGKGKSEMADTQARLHKQNRGGCPFSVA